MYNIRSPVWLILSNVCRLIQIILIGNNVTKSSVALSPDISCHSCPGPISPVLASTLVPGSIRVRNQARWECSPFRPCFGVDRLHEPSLPQTENKRRSRRKESKHCMQTTIVILPPVSCGSAKRRFGASLHLNLRSVLASQHISVSATITLALRPTSA